MTQEELINVFKYIVKKCDMLINNGNYVADAYTQDTVEDIAELCNHILDGDYGKLVEVKEVQEEPIKDKFTFKAIPRLLDMIEPTDKAKSYVTKLADAFDSEGYYTDAKIVRENLKIMNGEKVPMATMDEEPVSEDLEEAAVEWFNSVKYKSDLSGTPINAFKSGAKWQEEQFEKNRLAACDRQIKEEAEREMDFVIGIIENEHRQPTFDDAIKYGIKLQKEQMQSTIELAEDHAMLAGMNKMEQQMIEKAIDGKVCAVYPSAKYNEVQYSVHYPVGVLPHKYGDKVKVIVVKEE